MKTILIHSLTGNNNRIFDPSERDGYNDPMIYLREQFCQFGYCLKISDNNNLDDCEWVFFFDTISVKPYSGWHGFARRLKTILKGEALVRDLYAECIKAGMENKIALFLWEPPSVIAKNWSLKNYTLFAKIFTWHDNFVDGRRLIKIHWPQTHKFPNLSDIPFSDKKLLVNISMNKFSHHPRELYSARRSAIRYFEQNQPENFDLYGVGWNHPVNIFEKLLPLARQIYPSYRGTVQNKWDVLPQYRFSLCYENICDQPGFVTEKIFDSMRAGCIPVYWGAPNIDKYVDTDAFIDRRHFKSDSELESYLTGITKKEYKKYQAAIQEYLHSEKFQMFLPAAFARTIINALPLKNYHQ